MFNITYNEIIEKIKKEKNLSEEDINSRIKKKIDVLGDLISKDGAAHIVANELGVKIFPTITETRLKINNLMPGLNSVGINAKVITIYDIRSFKTEKREGRVLSLLVGDETGTIRLVVWDEKLIDFIANNIKENDILKIKNAYSRGNNGYTELHLGNKSQIILNPEDVKIETIGIRTRSFFRKEIKDLNENDFAELIGTVVQVFEPRFYNACPECNKKIELEDEVYKCIQHGNVIPKEVPILNLFFDDGTANIRVTLFRELASKLVNNIEKFKDDPNEFENIKSELLGKQLKIGGKVIKNTMFDRIEFRAQEINEINAIELADELLKDIENEKMS